jgi:hypothetical protein
MNYSKYRFRKFRLFILYRYFLLLETCDAWFQDNKAWLELVTPLKFLGQNGKLKMSAEFSSSDVPISIALPLNHLDDSHRWDISYDYHHSSQQRNRDLLTPPFDKVQHNLLVYRSERTFLPRDRRISKSSLDLSGIN